MSAAFPRGGNIQQLESKGNKSVNKRSAVTEDDTLFGSKRSRPIDGPKRGTASKKRTRSEETHVIPTPSVGLGMAKVTAGNKVIKIESLSVEKFTPGCLVLGYTLQLFEDHILVSLPGGITGNVYFREISDVCAHVDPSTYKLSDLVAPMQPVRCIVLGQVGQGRLETLTLTLSMRSSLINRGASMKHLSEDSPVCACVMSKEDHGYVMNLGIAGITAFLPLKGLPTSHPGLVVGQPVECVVETLNEVSHTVTLRAHKTAVSQALSRSSALTFNTLIAGMLVHTVVDSITQNGVTVSFLGHFHGVIHATHLWAPLPTAQWQARMTPGDTLLARIVFVDHGSKSVQLSVRPHVVELRAPRGLPMLGEYLSNLQVVQVNKRSGILLSNGSDSEKDGGVDGEEDEDGAAEEAKKFKGKKAAVEAEKKQRAKDEAVLGVYIKRSDLFHEECNDAEGVSAIDMERLFKPGVEIDARVRGYRLVEGFVIASNIPEVMTGAILHASSVSVGQCLEGEVSAVHDFGLKVNLGGKVSAICPNIHLFDTGGSVNPQKKFKVGQKLNLRVWEVSGSQILVTNKKTIVEDTGPVMSSYEDVTEGMVCVGVVSKTSDEGIRVHFYNKVSGKIPMSILVKQGVTDAEEAYRVGQIIRCVVLKKTMVKEHKAKSQSDSPSYRLVLGLNIGDTSKILTSDALEASRSGAVDGSLDGNQSGLVPGTIVKAGDDGISVRLDDGRLGLLSIHHATDLAVASEALVKHSPRFEAGKRLEQLLPLSVDKGVVQLSLKPLLLHASKQAANDTSTPLSERLNRSSDTIFLPSRVADMSPGQLVAGYVFKVEEYGVLVKFRDNLTAIAPRPNLAEKFVSSSVGLFAVGDSVRCVIQRVDLEKERAVVTFKPAFVSPSSGELCYVSVYLRDSYFRHIFLIRSQEASSSWMRYQLGSVIEASVLYLKHYGILLMAADQTTMILVNNDHKTSNSEVTTGSTVRVRLLDIDPDNKVFEASMEPQLLDVLTSTKGKKAKKNEAISSSSATGLVSLAPGQRLDARIELVKEKYLVVSCSGHIGYVMVADYHTPYKDTKEFTMHQTIRVRVERCPKLTTGAAGRSSDGPTPAHPYDHMLMLSTHKDGTEEQLAEAVRVQREAEQADAKLRVKLGLQTPGDMESLHADVIGSKQQASFNTFIKNLRFGAVARWEIVEIKPTEMRVTAEGVDVSRVRFKAVVHLSGAIDHHDAFDDLEGSLDKAAAADIKDRSVITSGHPFWGMESGGKVTCSVLQVRKSQIETDDGVCEEISVYLALLPSMSKAVDKDRIRSIVQWTGSGIVKVNTLYAVAVTDVDDVGCTVALSPYVSSRLRHLDVSRDTSIVKRFKQLCYVGLRLVVAVTDFREKYLAVNRARVERLLTGSASLILGRGGPVELDDEQAVLAVGAVVKGVLDLRCKQCPRPPAVMVSLGDGRYGRICITEIADRDKWADLSDCWEPSERSSSAGADSIPEHVRLVGALRPDAKLPGGVGHGSVVSCRVLSYSESESSAEIELSLRPSRLKKKLTPEAAVEADRLPTEGMLTKGFVAHVSNKGCFLRISRELTALVYVKDLSDSFLESPGQHFPTGKLVEGRVLSVNETSRIAKMSLKPSVVLGDEAQKELKSIREGQIMEGTVRRIEHFGVFVKLQGTSLVGLSRSAMAAPLRVKDLNDVFEVGDVVRAKVLGVNGSKIALGLKPSFFGDEEEEEEEEAAGGTEEGDGDDAEDEEAGEEIDGVDDESGDGAAEEDYEDGIIMPMEVDDSDDEEMEALVKNAALADDDDDGVIDEGSVEDVPLEKPPKRLRTTNNDEDDEDEDESASAGNARVGGGIFGIGASSMSSQSSAKTSMFQWDDFTPAVVGASTASEGAEDGESEDEDEEGEQTGRGKRVRQKVTDRRNQELDIRRREAALADGSLVPEAAEDFDRLLLAQPSSSLLWIRYMSFHLLNADVDAARAVGERALRTIGFREEEEKYNVWLALLNLEYKFGTMESLEALFKRAVAESRAKYLHLHLAEQYEKAGDKSGAEAMFERTLKRFKKSKKVWMAYQAFRLRIGDSTAAKALLARSLQSLERHKHLAVLSKYAATEFDIGSISRGREVFEEMVRNYPKKTDIWHVYVDKEVKSGNIAQARKLFERMSGLKTNSKNMQTIFKKHLAFELKYGDEESQTAVKERAREYVEKLL